MNLATILQRTPTAQQFSPVVPVRVNNPTIHEIESEKSLKKFIVNEVGNEALSFITQYANMSGSLTFLTTTISRFDIENFNNENLKNIVNLNKINDIRWLNKFFESVNSKLENESIYISSVETFAIRRNKILTSSIRPFNWMHYACDAFITRVIPKLPVAKKIYFSITKGRGRVLSRAETFGRLYSCGFEIIDEKLIGNELYFAARKIKEPHFDNHPTYGPIIRLKRYGKDGKLFNVYKLRTMHAYSEYLQDYVYKQNNLKEGGKFHNDFRISTEGRIFRKLWIDELPMFINVFKGNMKIVGVRPLSKHYFNLYSHELREKRIKYKPGLVPPFYADNPKTLDEIMASEMKYLEAYEKHPFKTDVKYFFMVFYNIMIKRARSS